MIISLIGTGGKPNPADCIILLSPLALHIWGKDQSRSAIIKLEIWQLFNPYYL